MNEQFRWAQENDVDLTAWAESGGLRTSYIYQRSVTLRESVKADPFIPPGIRKSVVEFLRNRANVHHKIEIEAQLYYKRVLAQGKRHEDLDENWHWVHNHINDELYENCFGISQVEEKVNDLRLEMQRYLEFFSP